MKPSKRKSKSSSGKGKSKKKKQKIAGVTTGDATLPVVDTATFTAPTNLNVGAEVQVVAPKKEVDVDDESAKSLDNLGSMNAQQLVNAYRSVMDEIRSRERSADAPQLGWRLYNGMNVASASSMPDGADTDTDSQAGRGDGLGLMTDVELTAPECRDAMEVVDLQGNGRVEGVVQLAVIGGGPAGLSA